ncbi:MAG: Cof-type HAD-IIB family hydrolase [Thermoleophilia bacterium]
MSDELFRPDLVAVDLDGTLLLPDLEFVPGGPAAVAALRGAGVPFVLSTGRMFRSARRVARELGVDDGPVVCYQGAMVADLRTGEPLLHHPIGGELAAEVVLHLRTLGRHVNAFIADDLYVEELDEWARRYAQHSAVEINLTADLAAEVAARAPTKFVVQSPAADVPRLVQELQAVWRGRLNVTRSQAEYIELVDAAVSKSAALQWLCERLGLRRERVVACGDGGNDVDMLRWAGLGVAMAEAAPEVRAVAGLVVPRAGLAALLERLSTAPFAGTGSEPRAG